MVVRRTILVNLTLRLIDAPGIDAKITRWALIIIDAFGCPDTGPLLAGITGITVIVRSAFRLYDTLTVLTDSTIRAAHICTGIINAGVVVITDVSIGAIAVGHAGLYAVVHDTPLTRRAIVAGVTLLPLTDVTYAILPRRTIRIILAWIHDTGATFTMKTRRARDVFTRVLENTSTILADVAGARTITTRVTLRSIDTGSVLASKLVRTIRICYTLRVIHAHICHTLIAFRALRRFKALNAPVFGQQATGSQGVHTIVISIATWFTLTSIGITPHTLGTAVRSAIGQHASPVLARISIRAIRIALTFTLENACVVYTPVCTGAVTVATTFTIEDALLVLTHIPGRTLRGVSALPHPSTPVFYAVESRVAIRICLALRFKHTTAIDTFPSSRAIEIRPAFGVVLAPGVHTLVVRRAVVRRLTLALVDTMFVHAQVKIRTVLIGKTFGANSWQPVIIMALLPHRTACLVATKSPATTFQAPSIVTGPALSAITVN